MATPPLGRILPRDYTKKQQAAADDARASMPKFAIPGAVIPTGPVKVMLTDFWKDPLCVSDMGQEFTGFGQYTGSCVGVSTGDAICTLSCVQRRIAENPTKAFIPWWPFPYGKTRQDEGDRGQGEGAIDSVMFKTLIRQGVFDIKQDGLPVFGKTGADGFWLSKQLELQWSDGARIDPKWATIAAKFPLKAAALLHSPEDIKMAIINGYPVLDGCDRYIGNGSIKGSGENAYVVGHYDGSGGHSTCYLGYWDHPNDGPLYLYSNQWPTSTYPKDPAGAGRCCVWATEAEVVKLFKMGGDGETAALSGQTYFPAQPEVLECFI